MHDRGESLDGEVAQDLVHPAVVVEVAMKAASHGDVSIPIAAMYSACSEFVPASMTTDEAQTCLHPHYSRSLNEIAARKPARVLRPTALAFPMWTASGIIADAIIVSIAPAASPSAKTSQVGSSAPASR